MELSRCSRASVKSGSYFRPVPKHFVRVPVLVFFLGFRKGAVGGVADDVFDAEKLRVGSGAIEEHALEHVVVAGAGVAGSVVLDGEDELRVVLGGLDGAEVDVVSGQRRGAGLGICVAGGTSCVASQGRGPEHADFGEEFATMHCVPSGAIDEQSWSPGVPWSQT